MPKKKSIKLAAQRFGSAADEISGFLLALLPGKSKDQVSLESAHVVYRGDAETGR